MCERDPHDELLSVRLQLDLLYAQANRMKHFEYEGDVHPLACPIFNAKLDACIRARDTWLITRKKKDGDKVKELAQAAIQRLNLAKVKTPAVA